MTVPTPVTATDVGNQAVDGMVNTVAGMANNVPFGLGTALDLGDRIKAAPAVQQLQSDARSALTEKKDPISSFFGGICQWIANIWNDFMSWLDKTLPKGTDTPDAPATTPTTPASTTPAAATSQTTAHDATHPDTAPSTPAAAKPNKPALQK